MENLTQLVRCIECNKIYNLGKPLDKWIKSVCPFCGKEQIKMPQQLSR